MRKKLAVISVLFLAALFAAKLVLSATQIDNKKNKELFKQIELFSDTLAIIQTDYVEDVKAKDLIYGALKGMLSALDPHSQFLDPDTYNELRVDTEGKFGGIGIEITIKDSLLTVVTPIEDTPAWKAGIKAKDRIVKINNELTRDITLTDAVKKLRGKVGEAVNITILRESEKKLLEFKIVRGVIKIQDIKGARILEDGIGYIRLVEFRENTADELQKALDRLMSQDMKGLILDLRNNPGGLLDVAVEVSGMFLQRDKLVVSTKGRIPSQNMEFLSRTQKPLTDIPMIVMINEGSASGSEIVAAALQEHKRAIVLGAKSFGKGSVQTIIPLNDGSALRLTTSKYFTPLNNQIHGKGITPDIVVEEVQSEPKPEGSELEPEAIFEEIENKDKKPQDEKKAVKDEDPLDYKNDSQLLRAIDVLKAIRIFKNGGVTK